MTCHASIKSFPALAALSLLAAGCVTPAMEVPRPTLTAADAQTDEADAPQPTETSFFNRGNTAPIRFEGAVSTIRHGTVVWHYPGFTEVLSGTYCNYGYGGNAVGEWTGSIQGVGNWNDEVGRMVHDALLARGVDMAGNPEALFTGSDDRQRARYFLGAQLIEMRGNICDTHHWWDGRPLGTTSAEIWIKTNWFLYDPLSKQEVGKFTTDGYGIQREPTRTGLNTAFYGAWRAASDALGADPDFQAFLRQDANPRTANRAIEGETIVLPALPLRTATFAEVAQDITAGTVTIRVGSGHGSGFLISRDGHILTNQHVVGGANTARVVFPNGMEVDGEVLRRHTNRDVALVKVPLSGGDPFPLRLELPRVSDDVYAIGSPLDEELQSTVTRGIVSAIRRDERTDMLNIQGDLDIQGGNSGGPLVDANGNVVGISVSGIGRDGMSVGINFFIPVASALEYLNIRVEDRLARN